MAAAAAGPILPALLSPLSSRRTIHRIPAPAASPICRIFGSRRLDVSPFVSCTFRQGLVPVSRCRIHNSKNRSVGGCAGELAVPARRCLSFSRVGLFELRGGVCQSRGAVAGARAGAGAVRGDSGFVEYEWVKQEAVEGAKGAKQFLMAVLNNLEARRPIIMQWAIWLAVVIGTVTLAGVLASRFALGRVFPAIVIAASLCGLLAEDEKLQLFGEGFESVCVKAGRQVHSLSKTISKVAHNSRKSLASCLSSIIPNPPGKVQGDNVKKISSEDSLLISEARASSFAPGCSNKDSRIDSLGLDCNPPVETLVTNISESIAQLSSIITTTGLSAASSDSLSGIKSGIQDLCRELQSVEAALLDPKSELEVNPGLVDAPESQVIEPQWRRSRSSDPWENDCTTRPIEEQLSASSGDLSISKLAQVVKPHRIRMRSPDPWQNVCTTGPIAQHELARGKWAADSSEDYRNDQGSQALDLAVINNAILKTETPIKDGIGNSRGVSTYGRVDFWGKNAGSISKTPEQRGILTKSNATARGSGFGSVDDLDGDRFQEQRTRRSLEEEEQQSVSRDLPSKSRAGREPPRDEQRMYVNADSSAAADDYRRVEVDVRGPQVLRVDRDLEETSNTPLVGMERRSDERTPQPRYRTDPGEDLVYPASGGRRPSPPGRTVSTRISNNGPSTSREGEGRWSTQSIDDGRIADGGNYSGSNRVRDMLPNPEGVASRGQGSGPGNGKGRPDSSLAYTPTQPEVTGSSFALEQSKQAQTVKFQNYLDEAEALLEQGMQGLEGRMEVGVAERMLYEAADLLGKACQLYPTDLIAVGQLGNTLLVHGQLKLKLSQQLRSMLPSPKANYPLMKAEAAVAGREQELMELSLQEVCEECEELLVDAGRKFRTALSLDKSDVRALYNWGLALCYRGQLIAEEGGERAKQDADKVFLAAIDKFEAMLGISQDFVSGALLNWGLAMQDRARLRDMGDKERVQLLLQAKELFQDAVRLDSTSGQARGALAVCSAELKELQGFDALQRGATVEKPKQNWWQRRG